MTNRYEPKFRWKRTQIDKDDPPTDFDWMGYDDGEPIGRIRKELHGPTKGKWQWAGWYSRKYTGAPPTPNTGWVDTARIATQKVEEYWERSKQVMRPRGDGIGNSDST